MVKINHNYYIYLSTDVQFSKLADAVQLIKVKKGFKLLFVCLLIPVFIP